MREIKFRFLRPENIPNGEEYYVGIDGGAYKLERGVMVEKKDVIVMQYTGKKDENGKEIYEGDVLKDKNGVISVVIFDNAMFVGRTENKMNAYKWRESEIIGDIYENPELDSRYKELKDEQIMETAREVKDGIKESNEES